MALPSAQRTQLLFFPNTFTDLLSSGLKQSKEGRKNAFSIGMGITEYKIKWCYLKKKTDNVPGKHHSRHWYFRSTPRRQYLTSDLGKES